MKVVFDHQIFYSQRYGGISRYFRELSLRLARTVGTRVAVVAPFHANEYLRRGSELGLGWPYFGYQFRYAGGLRSRARRFLLPRLYARHHDADILHETYFSETAFGTGRVRVLTVYDMIYEIYPEYFRDAPAVTQAKRAAVDRCNHVICISESTRQDLIRIFDVAPERTSVVHLGYDLLPSSQAAGALAGESARPFILYVGKRGLYKNFARLVEAFSTSAQLTGACDIVAFGESAFTSDERHQFASLGITDRVRHVAGDDALLEAHYRNAVLFVFPSLYEGFGIPPLEAMSFGCPVACSASSSIPEVVGDAAAYFDPNSLDSIRATLEQVVASDALRADLVAKGYERLKHFSWDRCAEETAAIYRTLLVRLT